MSKIVFGNIDNIKVGDVFESRKALAKAGIHNPLMSGISGTGEGACSIVLSGGYEDDVDDLNYILYTGQGGQDKPGGKQVSDQDFIKGGGFAIGATESMTARELYFFMNGVWAAENKATAEGIATAALTGIFVSWAAENKATAEGGVK